MIHRLRLRNWRCYEHLDLPFDPGTTFVVAPNGVGKTSLVYGLAWGVFGKHSGIPPRTCIRVGAESAEVAVELELPGERQLRINRTVRRRGAPTARFEMNGKTLTERSAIAEMEEALRIDLAVAGRLSMMLGGGHIAANDVLNLEGHLHHVFGVTDLLDAAETAQSVAKEAEKARGLLRSTTRRRMEDRASLESEISKIDEDIDRLNYRGTELRQVRDAAAAQRSLVEQRLALIEHVERYERKRSELVAKIERVLGRPITADSNDLIGSELRSDLEISERAIVEMDDRLVASRTVIKAAEQAIRLLDGNHVTCPTCMRPLPHHELTSAISAHRTQQVEAEAEVRRVEDSRRATRARAQQVSQLLAQLEALQPPSIRIDETSIPTQAAAHALYERTSADLDEHHQRLGAAQSRLEALRAQIASDDQLDQEERSLRLAYRREAAAVAGAEVLRKAADQVIDSCIEPIASEVRGRWKHLFTNNGLTFRADGSITRIRDGEELAWDTLSGGERTWARIVTHLIVVGTTTALPFAWFDEPLEHLDPQLRHAVAATLATATRGSFPRQLLVTTYEHAIAQQLADDTDGAEIVAIRESGTHLARVS